MRLFWYYCQPVTQTLIVYNVNLFLKFITKDESVKESVAYFVRSEHFKFLFFLFFALEKDLWTVINVKLVLVLELSSNICTLIFYLDIKFFVRQSLHFLSCAVHNLCTLYIRCHFVRKLITGFVLVGTFQCSTVKLRFEGWTYRWSNISDTSRLPLLRVK